MTLKMKNLQFSRTLSKVFMTKVKIPILEGCQYSRERKYRHPHYRGNMFSWFSPSFQKYSVTNDTSFESPKIELLESSMKLGVAWPWAWPHPLKWKSTSSAKTNLEPFTAKICSVSKLLSDTGWYGSLLRYRTLSYLNWHRNGKPLKFEVQKNCMKKVHFTI